MRARLARAVAPAILIAILSNCAHERRPSPAQPAPARGLSRIPPATLLLSNDRYVATSGSIDLFVIRSSEIALQRSGSARVHRLASILIDAHKGTSAQLSFAGRRLNLLPAAALEPKHQAMLQRLLSAANFDATYLSLERTVHQQALSLDRAYLAQGRSPTLRPVAAERIPIMERDLALLN